jgi:hypothetical protein
MSHQVLGCCRELLPMLSSWLGLPFSQWQR